MGRFIAKAVILGALVLTTTACARLESGHGYVPEPSALEGVVVGRDTKDIIGLTLGQPGTRGIVDDLGWYYVRSDYERFLWRAPVEVDRQVVAITFDEAGVVRNIERFGLEEGRVVALNRRVTDANTQGISFLRQLFGNLGNFDPATLINEN
ncbi:outer membrane protein assembly factor BamE [Boseongicola aestuarii]|uniref:SmpA / OmlA family protein n=1 Tax=Boseongicola aestuarii TaxID=1470561 RepID=A0A238IWG0_9RHOB|nr:outer membrane protein assembly factor BamE [Boseongicola aestuarii]SMX22312.1 SmpA / OmlA family protein [Boseongicola aestuarii]